MKEHVIFLDVDGVMDSVESQYKLDDVYFHRLKTLIDWFDADIILSSTWRKNPEDYTMFNENLKRCLNIELAGKTGVDEHRVRGKEILSFLTEHPEVSDYVVIDDDSADITPYITLSHFIKTDGFIGLQDYNIKRFIERREHYRKHKELCLQQLKNGETWDCGKCKTPTAQEELIVNYGLCDKCLETLMEEDRKNGIQI